MSLQIHSMHCFMWSSCCQLALCSQRRGLKFLVHQQRMLLSSSRYKQLYASFYVKFHLPGWGSFIINCCLYSKHYMIDKFRCQYEYTNSITTNNTLTFDVSVSDLCVFCIWYCTTFSGSWISVLLWNLRWKNMFLVGMNTHNLSNGIWYILMNFHMPISWRFGVEQFA